MTRRFWSGVSVALAGLLVLPIRGYQIFISPLFGPTCRFHPSCSSYAITALQRHGPVKGLCLAGWRLLRCNPWNPGGVDDVPAKGWRRRESPQTLNTPHP